MQAGRKRSRSFSATENLSRSRLPETVSKTASKQTKTTPFSLFGERKKRINERVVGTAVLIPFLKEDLFIGIYVICVSLHEFMCTVCMQELAEARSSCMLL